MNIREGIRWVGKKKNYSKVKMSELMIIMKLNWPRNKGIRRDQQQQ